MPSRALVVPLICGDHVVPLSVVASIPPASPTTKQVVGLGHATPSSIAPVFVWPFQVMPPLVVASMPPASPTAKQAVALGQATPLREWVVLVVWGAQVAPPSVVARIVPAPPTAKQAVA